MSQFETMLGRMPVRTWSRPRVNDAGLVLREPDDVSLAGGADIRASGQIIIKQSYDRTAFGEDLTGPFVPEGLRVFIEENTNRRHLIRIPKGYAEREPIVLTLHLGMESPVLVDDVVIEAEEDASAVVILKYTSDDGTRVQHFGRTRVIVRRNARVQLVKLQMLPNDAAHTDAVGGVAQAGARLDVILAELGAARPLSSCNLILEGDGANAELDVVYLGDGERSLDMSYRAEHRGRKTVSGIYAKGILMDRSKKIFRDTLDFKSGASGSKGREEENVLMLGRDVRNISVPLLLCGEDNVEGEHAASSGRPDEKVLFYLMSRGLGELEAKKLLAQAAVSSIVEKIPEASVRNEILGAVRRSIGKGGAKA
ncbi:Uncharacterized protein family (UPF0051) [Sporobacter termitidis DSM 10068]|uniref:Uncharacterized protein family (UPF0051) n=1 Tax=Sporobacter termitidis DSM 10068 TaxID=1123282 RepID=A0A1M5WIT8_9FIRM|nr:SufD family Fe-S cluster assembly protein [Sporobacter termitidis]SHH87436.1 Uncharacterized protein family (UPF0051) [Sporobacter termitidis DSM 10068]